MRLAKILIIALVAGGTVGLVNSPSAASAATVKQCGVVAKVDQMNLYLITYGQATECAKARYIFRLTSGKRKLQKDKYDPLYTFTVGHWNCNGGRKPNPTREERLLSWGCSRNRQYLGLRTKYLLELEKCEREENNRLQSESDESVSLQQAQESGETCRQKMNEEDIESQEENEIQASRILEREANS